MKANAYVLASLVGIFVLVGVFAVAGFAGEKVQVKKLYSDFITKAIEKNHSKATLRRSRSANLQSAAAVAIQKARFLSVNRTRLIDEMVKKQVGLKYYLMDYYLNKRFHQSQAVASSVAQLSAN